MFKLIPRTSKPLIIAMPTIIPCGNNFVQLFEVSPVFVGIQKRHYARKKDSNGDDSFFSRATGGIFSPKKPEDLHKEYSEKRLMGYNMEQMFSVVVDVASYQNFLPWCQKSVILSQGQNEMLAELTIGISPLKERYTSNVVFKQPYRIRAESAHGRLFNKLVNDWRFSPGIKSQPNSCIVDFSVSFEFKSHVQAKLGNIFFDETAKAMTAAFYQEAQRRFGKESLPSLKIQIIPKEET